jgi:plasmid stabilization system protein ParE
MKVVLDPRAEDDLRAYLQYVHRDSLEAALRQDQRVADALWRLALHPRLGRKVRIPEWSDEVHSFPLQHTPLRAFYVARPEGGIYVIRLYHGARTPLAR